MRKIFIFFLGIFNIYSYDLRMGIKDQLFFEKDIKEYRILTVPKDSQFILTQENSNMFNFKAESLGVYKFIFVDEFGKNIEKTINVLGKKYKEEGIKTILLTKGTYNGIKEIYFFSNDLLESQKTIYNYLLKKSREKENIDYILSVFIECKLFIKNFKEEQNEFLEKLYINKRELGDIRAEILILNILKEDSRFYKILYGKRAVETGIEEEKGVEILKKLWDESLDKEAAKLLGVYFLDRGKVEGEKYLYYADKKEFFKYLLKQEKIEEFDYYFNQATTEEQEEALKIKDEYNKENIIALYLQKGKLNMEQERYELSKEYYNKVIEFSRSEKQLKEALFYLGKLYIVEENYEKSIEIFNAYLAKYDEIEEVEALFYLGLSNFKLKNTEKSDIIFNQIKKTYKYSIWDEKIKKLLKEIE